MLADAEKCHQISLPSWEWPLVIPTRFAQIDQGANYPWEQVLRTCLREGCFDRSRFGGEERTMQGGPLDYDFVSSFGSHEVDSHLE